MQLLSKDIEVADGLNDYEFSEIESLYSIKFPVELKKFYSRKLPVSAGFYNWRDKRSSNMNLIKGALDTPLKEITDDLREELFWCDKWGVRPAEFIESNRILLRRYEEAPKLIPIYSHRYIPFVEDAEEVPIFSVHGTDIIYYGDNLISYLEIEFGFRKYDDIDRNNYQYIPFWSDFL